MRQHKKNSQSSNISASGTFNGREHHSGKGNPTEGRRVRRKWIFVGIVSVHAGIAISWGISYWLMGLIYHVWFPDYGHPILRQYLTVVLAITLLFILLHIIRVISKPDGQHKNPLMQMIDAMQRLTKGDFNVNLELNPRTMGHFGPLVSSFNEMASELNQMEQMRQEFISNVSHEIQSPLTSITGFAQALQSDKLPQETRQHYLEIIETESKRLSRMSDNLLKLTSLESNHPFEPKHYRLDRQLRRIILSCEPLWREKRMEMDVELPEIMITADEDLLDQVWINLIHNSIKFTPEGGKISVKLISAATYVSITVSNSGEGISEDALPHLFERFYKADKARNRSSSGSGLGLSIVKKIVDMHGGEVTVNSRLSEGAEFNVHLPQFKASFS